MQAGGSTVFETAVGHCGVAWSPAGLCAVQLPEGNRARTAERLQRRFAMRMPGMRDALIDIDGKLDDAPVFVQRAVAAIVQLLSAEGVDDARAAAAVLADVALDTQGISEPYQRIYAITRNVPPGATITYGEIARALGDVTLARMVGQAMGRNPWPIVVPCHRVLGSDGTLTGFSAHGGVDTKRRLLAIEGVRLPHTPSLFDAPEADAGARSDTRTQTHVRRDAAPDAHES